MDHFEHSRRTRRTLVAKGAVALATLAVGVASAGCSTHATTGTPTGTDPTSAPLGDGNPGTITKAANDVSFTTPYDATPSPAGDWVYFTALSPSGAGIFKVPAAGGPATPLFVGDPLAHPVNIAVSPDGKQLFVADTGAETGDIKTTGAVFVVSVDGGTPSTLGGSVGSAPRGIETGAGAVYFTGTSGKLRVPTIFKAPLAGGDAQPVFTGAPLVDPGGVAVDQAGNVYVADTSGSPAGLGMIYKLAGGALTVVASDFAMGYPAGIALAQNEGALLVSALDPSTRRDAVYRVDLASGESALLAAGLEKFTDSAGLHRARGGEVYAWADARANKTGTVYVLTK